MSIRHVSPLARSNSGRGGGAAEPPRLKSDVPAPFPQQHPYTSKSTSMVEPSGENSVFTGLLQLLSGEQPSFALSYTVPGIVYVHRPLFSLVVYGSVWVGDRVNLLPVAQQTNILTNGGDGRTRVSRREIKSHHPP